MTGHSGRQIKVAEYGVQYMKGLQDEGVMACAKHFPGHGDVSSTHTSTCR
jgi:beta-glucosidase-like glycosyl hydrolase